MIRVSITNQSIDVEDIKQSIHSLLGARENESEHMPNGKLFLKYYTMALSDLYFSITGQEDVHED